MRARTISRLRKVINDKNYYYKRMKKFASICSMWDEYYEIKCENELCNEVRELNEQYYNFHGLRSKRKFQWYKKKYKERLYKKNSGNIVEETKKKMLVEFQGWFCEGYCEFYQNNEYCNGCPIKHVNHWMKNESKNKS